MPQATIQISLYKLMTTTDSEHNTHIHGGIYRYPLLPGEDRSPIGALFSVEETTPHGQALAPGKYSFQFQVQAGSTGKFIVKVTRHEQGREWTLQSNEFKSVEHLQWPLVFEVAP